MKKFILFISILFFYGCEKVINIETEYSNERVVIDASLFKNIKENFATAIVKVSKTAPYFSENNTVIEDAVVFIKTKNGNIKLNFNTEKKYYTNTIDYISFEEDYELLINYKEQNYYSSEKIIQIPEIESITFGTRKSLQKDEVELLVTFTDPVGIGNYYLWKFGPKGIGNKYDYVTSRDTYINGNKFTFSFFIDKNEYFKYDDIVITELSGITKECYDYLNILTSQAGAQSGRPFSSANAIIKGNIINQSNPEKFPLGYYRVSEFDYFSLSKQDAPDGVFD